MLVTMKRENGRETIGVNSDRVTWEEPASDGRSRICFAGNQSVVVDGAVEQVLCALAGP